MTEVVLRIALIVLTSILTTLVCDRRRNVERCHLCRNRLGSKEVMVCGACETAATDQLVRARLAELDVREAVALARGIALRDGERELAGALQAVLLLHLTGGSLALIAALVRPEPGAEAVN